MINFEKRIFRKLQEPFLNQFMRMKNIACCSLLFLSMVLNAQRTYQKDAELAGIKSLEKFISFLALPNDGREKGELEKNIDWSRNELGALGFRTALLTTSSMPLVVADLVVDKQLPTVAFYLHLDGQAIDPSKWEQESPWKAVLKTQANGHWEAVSWEKASGTDNKELRIFARSSSDDKGPFIMLTTALQILTAKDQSPAFNVKLILDFEEESSSPGLPEAVGKYKEQLKADLLLILDGPMHASGEPTLVFGNRGISALTLTTYGPATPQHSGHYGNYIPNPALRLTQILGSMKDSEGRVTIPGFYEGIVIDKATSAILNKTPNVEAAIQQRTKIGSVDYVGRTYQESLQYPSLNIRGLKSGWVGKQTRTIIPATATAEIDVRLVLESNPEKLIASIKKHIEAMGYTVLNTEPTDEQKREFKKIVKMTYKISYPAFRTPVNSKGGKWLSKTLEEYYGSEPIKIRTSGGSVPISPFVNQLGVPAIGLPTVNIDNNQHSPNENLRLGNYFSGIETFIFLLEQKF